MWLMGSIWCAEKGLHSLIGLPAFFSSSVPASKDETGLSRGSVMMFQRLSSEMDQ